MLLTVEKTAAAVAGALEGYRSRLEQDHPGEAVREALDTVRSTREEVRSGAGAWDTPELRRVGGTVKHGVQRTTESVTNAGHTTGAYARDTMHRTGDRARGMKDSATSSVTHARETAQHKAEAVKERTLEAKQHATETVTHAREAAAESVEHAREVASEKYHEAEHRVKETAADVRVKAGAVQESGRRATRAPGMIMRDVKQGVSEMSSNWAKALGMLLGAGLLAFTAFILLTIFLVVLLNELLGDPWGTLITTLLWLVVAGVAAYGAKKAIGSASNAKKHMGERVREDVDYVKRPVRREFGRGA